MRRLWASGERVAVIAAIAGVVLLVATAVSDFVIRSFWQGHAMLTSLVANLIVVIVSVAVISKLVERRNRRRWNVLAQNVMFELAQCARLTWTSMLAILELAEAGEDGPVEGSAENLALALDPGAVQSAAERLLPDAERRRRLQLVIGRLSDHASRVITNWAGVMVGAAPYANLLDRHVELQSRMEWLGAVMAHQEPPPDADGRRRRLTRASIAVSAVAHLGDPWLSDQATAIAVLAAQLDRESMDLAFSVNSPDWWTIRTDQLLQRP